MVEVSEDINFVKEVGLPRGQFRGAAAIRGFQDVRQGQSCHCGISFIDFQHVDEHNAVQGHTLHSPDLHFFAKICFI